MSAGQAAGELGRRIRSLILDVPDFPAPGILFRDILPVLAEPEAFAAVVEHVRQDPVMTDIDVVVGVEARGFLLAAPIALAAGLGVVPLRKPGKLPGPIWSSVYDLEYGADVLELQRTALRPGQRVLLVDDVLATGGTLTVASRLVALTGASVAAAWVLVELADLGGRTGVPGPVTALLTL